MGIRPRTISEKRTANYSTIAHTGVWVILLALISVIIYFTKGQ
jgi:hypothetical protein